jgi:hypothetical protein
MMPRTTPPSLDRVRTPKQSDLQNLQTKATRVRVRAGGEAQEPVPLFCASGGLTPTAPREALFLALLCQILLVDKPNS